MSLFVLLTPFFCFFPLQIFLLTLTFFPLKPLSLSPLSSGFSLAYTLSILKDSLPLTLHLLLTLLPISRLFLFLHLPTHLFKGLLYPRDSVPSLLLALLGGSLSVSSMLIIQGFHLYNDSTQINSISPAFSP